MGAPPRAARRESVSQAAQLPAASRLWRFYAIAAATFLPARATRSSAWCAPASDPLMPSSISAAASAMSPAGWSSGSTRSMASSRPRRAPRSRGIARRARVSNPTWRASPTRASRWPCSPGCSITSRRPPARSACPGAAEARAGRTAVRIRAQPAQPAHPPSGEQVPIRRRRGPALAARARKLLHDGGFAGVSLACIVFFPRWLPFLRRFEPWLSWLPLGGQTLLITSKPVIPTASASS